MIRTFADGPDPVDAVGGKAASLQAMTAAGFTVPPGVVLPVACFAPWMDQVRASPAWAAFAGGDEADDTCAALRRLAEGLALPDDLARALHAALGGIGADRWAVRSSSPEEDLDGSSFAGGYETVLGVPTAEVPGAVARAFASCFDARVVRYKAQRGFDVFDPRIAVVVQRQLAPDAAGVAFTVDPIDGDADHVVINANRGLGESVVSGRATPDQWTLDKATGEMLATVEGAKETAVYLGEERGTVTRTPPPGPSLTDAQVREVAEAAKRAEAHFGRAIDLEWAFAGGRLNLLQARPVTTELDLPDDLRTEPGARRRLYWDATISLQGVLRPMSPLGTDALRRTLDGALSLVGGPGVTGRVEQTPVLARHGRLYVVLSNVFAVVPPERMGPVVGRNLDPLAGAAIAAASRERYASPVGVRALRFGALRVVPVRFLPKLLAALIAPARARRAAFRAVAAQRERLATAGLGALEDKALHDTGRTLVLGVLPRFAASRLARVLVQRLAPGADVDALDRALPHNVTVEMGLALTAVAALLPAEASAAELVGTIATRAAPSPLLAAWDAFMERYGMRGPGEIDAAVPRYREQPRLLLEQAATLRNAPASERPDALCRLAVAKREEATRTVLAGLGPLRRRLVGHLARVIAELGGLRELPKYLLVSAIDRVRTVALAEGERLAEAGAIPAAEAVFDLWLEDLVHPSPDLDGTRALRRAGGERLARTRDLPRVFDSRCRVIHGAVRPARPGELAGMPVAPGTARGPVKVLHAPDEKPLLRGEVLVARATDPGWTPLFVNAAAVVLEVGGALQHGALVAREYGRPCVTGIARATEVLEDGELVEVDGTSGVVRRLG